MKTNNKSIKLPRLFEVNYKTDEFGCYYTAIFVRLIDAINFLKILSKDYYYFFGNVFALEREPNSIGALFYENEVLFHIGKIDNEYIK